MSLDSSHLPQYAKIISFLIKYRNLANLSDAIDDEKTQDLSTTEYDPNKLVKDLKNMGPTFVKVGQLLSTRPDMIPAPYIEALSSLQEDVEERPYEEVEKIFEQEIGTTIKKAFKEFDKIPMASASIGQVHKAMLHSNKIVAVKIQRSGIKERFSKDLDSLYELGSTAVNISKQARNYAIDEAINEIKSMLLDELDYEREAENLLTLHKNLEQYELIVIPRPINGYCSKLVLTMEYIEGRKATSISKINLLEHNYEPVIDEFLEAYLKQITVDGIAHADPHPGNVYITPEGKLSLLDLGMVARFSPDLQETILKLMIAMNKSNGTETADQLLSIGKFDKDADIEGFRKETSRLLLENINKKAATMESGRILLKINKLAADKGIIIAPEINVLGKIMLNMDQIVAHLTPNYQIKEVIESSLRKLMQQKMKERLKPDNFFGQILEAKDLVEKLPERLNKIMDAMAANNFQIKVDAIDQDRFTDGFQKVANRISLGLIIAALIIGSALLMRVPSSFSIAGYPAIAMIFFIIAAIAGIWLIIKMLINDEYFKIKKK